MLTGMNQMRPMPSLFATILTPLTVHNSTADMTRYQTVQIYVIKYYFSISQSSVQIIRIHTVPKYIILSAS